MHPYGFFSAGFLITKEKTAMTTRPTDAELFAAAHRALMDRVNSTAPLLNPFLRAAHDDPATAARRERARRTSHRYSLYEAPRRASPKDTGAYVPELAARLDDDRNLTDGARRCARKLAEYTYLRNREGREAHITVTWLMKALRKCRRTVQRYLRQLECAGYIDTTVIQGDRSRLCVGLIIKLLVPLFPRHHAAQWPGKIGIAGATAKSQNQRFKNNPGKTSVEFWALRCMDGVWRAFNRTHPPGFLLAA
jgi:hypothetical protein